MNTFIYYIRDGEARCTEVNRDLLPFQLRKDLELYKETLYRHICGYWAFNKPQIGEVWRTLLPEEMPEAIQLMALIGD